jgi:DNA-binding NarL/FixJ family response regulator
MDTLESNLARLLIADNNLTFRVGLLRALETEKKIKILGSVSSADALYKFKKKLTNVDILIIDIDLPDHKSVEATRWMINKNPDCAVLLLCNWDMDVYLVTAWIIQAAGVLFRRQNSQEIANNIKDAQVGPIFTEDQFQRIIRWQETIGVKLVSLLPRERQVLKLIVAGNKNLDIANVLKLSKNMIEKYVSRIFKKMQLNSKTQLLSFVLENHLEIMLNLNVYD